MGSAYVNASEGFTAPQPLHAQKPTTAGRHRESTETRTRPVITPGVLDVSDGREQAFSKDLRTNERTSERTNRDVTRTVRQVPVMVRVGVRARVRVRVKVRVKVRVGQVHVECVAELCSAAAGQCETRACPLAVRISPNVFAIHLHGNGVSE